MSKEGWITVRIKDTVKEKIERIRSPGESIAGCIDRAISLLEEIKDITGRFSESPEYQAWLKQRQGGK